MAEKVNSETDDFLSDIDGEDFFEDTSSQKQTKKEEISSSPSQQPQQPSAVSSVSSVSEPTKLQNESIEEIPILRGEDYPQDYIKMVERIKAQYTLLPSLNYDALYKELAELSIKSAPTPTLQVLNDELHKVQSAKDRLSEILVEVIKCYNFKNRAVDILKDSWGKFTSEKNTESRKGDATFRLSDFIADFAIVEALFKACNHVFKNLDSLHDNLSRRITICQLLLKLRDMGRGALPDFDFDKSGEMKPELFGEDKEIDKGGIKEESF